MKIAAAIHDLMFSSKVNAAAKGQTVAWLPRGLAVAPWVAEQKPDLLLIDLGNAKLDPVAAITAVKGAAETKNVVVIGYIGHEQAETIAAAQAAGADQVMSKGEFARRLPELLGG
jgi:DNA-binding NarL/FixJ family response regulator